MNRGLGSGQNTNKVIQVRGGEFQEGAVGDGAGRRSGSKIAGLQRQRKGSMPCFDTQWVPSRPQSEE